MPGKFDIKLETTILTLSKRKMSVRQIQEYLKKENKHVSIGKISNVINGIGLKRSFVAQGLEIPTLRRIRKVRTVRIINKLQNIFKTANPPSQRNVASKLGVSQASINRCLHEDLQLIKCKKRKVQALTAVHKKNRKVNSRKLYERHLAGNKAEYVVTLDEAYFYLNNCNGERKICYLRKGEKAREEWLVYCKESFPRGFMVVGCFTGKGTLPMIKVHKNVKVSGPYYVEYVLKPLLEKHLKSLYPNEYHKIFLHHDKATSHTCKFTQEYLKDLQHRTAMDYIVNEDIPTKSPDISPLDFYGFGYLKQRLFHRRATTENGLWKVLNDVWNTITVADIKKVYMAWKRRCRLVHKMSGEHIEQTKTIHRRVITL